MRVVYDAATGRVLALGDAVEAGEGQTATELAPEESAALADAAATVEDLTARLRNAVAEREAAQGRYDRRAAEWRRAFGEADGAAQGEGRVVGFDGKGLRFVAIDGPPAPEPSPEDDEALVASHPAFAAMLRVLARQQQGGKESGR